MTLKKNDPGANPELWQLRLYVAGQTPKSITAFNNLKISAKNTSTAVIR